MESKPLTFSGALFIMFLYAKLTGQVNFNWWWVFSPLITSAIVDVAIKFIKDYNEKE